MNSKITTSSSPPKVVERETEVTKDTMPPTNNGSTEDVQPPIVQVENHVPISELVVDPVSAPMPNPKPSILYPSRRNNERRREKANDQIEKFYEIFKDLSFEISLTDALILMPKFASTLKALIGNKEKLSEMARTPLNEHCSGETTPKRKSADVGWEFRYLADPKHIDKGDVTACEKSTTEQKLKCRNALNEVKLKKKNKQAVDDALRSEVNIDSNEMVDLDEMEYSFGDLKLPTRFGPLDRFTTVEDCSGWGEKQTIGGLPRFKKTLDQAKRLTIFIYAHHKTLALMRHFTKKRDIVRPGVTRFASAFLTLQSLAKKKAQLRQVFTSDKWEKFKVLRMVDADWKPSMGFIYGELKKAKQEIMDALNNNEKSYAPILDIISRKASGRLDTALHMSAYVLNPYYLYNDLEVQKDDDLNDAIVELVETLFGEDYNMQNQITLHEFPMYKGKLEKFGRTVAIKGCEVNDEKYDPALWWSMYGGSTPNLKKIAMRILSLTTSSSGCERNWSTFEGVHTKKRNRLDATKMSNLVYVQFYCNLDGGRQKRKTRDHEVLLAQEAGEAQEWIVEGEVYEDRVEAGLPRETVSDDIGTRTSARLRELYEEEFESEGEVLNVQLDEES
ncbi:reverse transcriptase domain-containing protein [Tanacetum coccineum]|uniref:Reverse transcriptase domain-containing protein n=1 Tax=Tanacetum coccineum TaxID=301880 RepID=A0ABQ5G5M6_9ASTR